MRSMLAALAMCAAFVALSPAATAECTCACVRGRMQPLCTSTADIEPFCSHSPCGEGLGSQTEGPTTAASPLAPTTQRAAYCLGVLEVLVPAINWDDIQFDDLIPAAPGGPAPPPAGPNTTAPGNRG